MTNNFQVQKAKRNYHYAAILTIVAVALAAPIIAYGLLTAGLVYLFASTYQSNSSPNNRRLMLLALPLIGFVGFTCWVDFGLKGIAVIALLSLASWFFTKAK